MLINIISIRTFLILITAVLVNGCQTVEYVHVGPNWDELNNIKSSKKTFKVKATLKDKLKLGDKLEFEINSEQTGKLWIVRVDPNDEVQMLFPHDHAKDNTINANKSMNIPSKTARWHLEASKPVGKSIVAFIVTTGDTSLADVINKQKSMPKALRLVESSPQWGIDKHVIDVN